MDAAMAALGEGYFETDLKGRFTFVSEVLAATLQQPPSALLGQEATALLSPDEHDSVRQAFDRVFLTGHGVQSVTCSVALSDGRVRHLDVSAALLEGSGEGTPAGFRGLVRDVTDREQALAMTRATLDSQPTQICLLDRRGVIRVVNSAWDLEAGTSGSSIGFEVGANYLSALENLRQAGNPHGARELEGVRAVIEGRRREFSMEYPRPNPVRSRWYHLTATPLIVSGKLSGAVLSRVDITDRKSAEDELTTLYKAMDSSIDGLALLAPEGACLFINPAFAHLHGYDAPVELAGKNWRELYPPEELAKFDNAILPQLKRLGYWSGELRGLLKSGRMFQLEASFTLLNMGRVIICSARDVSGRKRAEAALRASEQKFRTIFDNVMEGIVVVDLAAPRILAANPAILQMFGYAETADLAQIDFLNHFKPEDQPSVVDHLARVVEDSVHSRRQYQITRSDGTARWIEALGALTEYEGHPAALVAVADVTERIESQRALQQSEVRLRAVIEGAQDVIFIKDVEGRYIQANPAMCSLFGSSAKDIEGRRDADLFDEEGAALSVLSDRAVLAGRTVGEEVVKAIHGERHAFHTVKVPMRNTDGTIFGICGIARDITERKRSEEELRRRDALLESAAVAFQELLSNPDFSSAISAALGTIGRASGADRVYVYQLHDHPETGVKVVSRRYDWLSPTMEARPNPETDVNVPADNPLGKLWAPILQKGACVRQLVKDLPAELRPLFGATGARSLLLVPVSSGGKTWGFVGFTDCHKDREWAKSEESILEAFAAGVGGALQRREAEDILQQSEERMRLLVEGTHDFFHYILDRDLKYIYISPENYEAVTGYSVEYMRGEHQPIVTDSPINTVAMELTRKLLDKGVQPPPYLWEIRRKDGRLATLEIYERPLFKNGEVVGLQGLAHDVTDRIKMESALKESEERFRFLVEHMPGTMFYVQNPDGSYAYMSPNAEAITGYTTDYLKGLHETITTDNPINPEALATTWRVLNEGYGPPPYRYEIRHKDGRRIMLEAYERPILRDRKVVMVLGLLHDISGRLEMENRLARYRKLEMMGHMSAGLAHEVRNPLNAIGVTLQAMEKKLSGQVEVEPYMRVVQDQTRRLANLIRDMLDLGRINDPGLREVRELDGLARQAVDVLSEDEPERRHRVVILPPEEPLLVHVEGSRIVEVFVNILENALAYGPQDRPVRVFFVVSGESIVAHVRDEGPGIADTILPSLFQPFVSNRQEGTGLGLAVVERIVTDHGGDVWAENNDPAPGCTFSFSLPKAEAN